MRRSQLASVAVCLSIFCIFESRARAADGAYLRLVQPNDARYLQAFDPPGFRPLNNAEAEERIIAFGYDSLLGELKPTRCVELNPGTGPLGEPTAPKTRILIDYVENLEEYVRSTGISAAAIFSWGAGSVDASVDYVTKSS